MPKLILSYRLWEEDGKTLFQVTGMDEAFRGKGKLFERKDTAVYSLYRSVLSEKGIYLRGDSFEDDNDIDLTGKWCPVISRKRIIKTLNAWARSKNPAIQKETDFTKTEFAYYYAEDDKPKCHWCGSEMKMAGMAVFLHNGLYRENKDELISGKFLECCNTKCNARSPFAPTEAEAIAKHNQIKR